METFTMFRMGTELQLNINSINEILLHVINIPDIVNLIKSYL